jgi:hypothetical protein
MEAFLLGLDSLIEEHSDLTVIDLLGVLQFTQQRLALDMLLNEDEDDDDDEA